MSKPELIAAYVSGRIARRDFVRKLTALGVSATAAAAYAQTLAPNAAAAGLGRDGSGLRVRSQTTTTYPGGDFGDLTAIINLLLKILALLEGILNGGLANAKTAPLRLQSSGELDPADADQLDTLQTQLVSHRDSLRTLLNQIGGTEETATVPDLTYDTLDDSLADLQSGIDTNLGVYAAVIPQVVEDKVNALTTFSSISLVHGRHGAFVNKLIGDPAFPDTFQPAATNEEVDQLLTALG